MSKRTKLAVFIGAVAAVISAVVMVVVFWDKLVALCPCYRKQVQDELSDYADLGQG